MSPGPEGEEGLGAQGPMVELGIAKIFITNHRFGQINR